MKEKSELKARKASVSRKTTETEIEVKLNIDGSGRSKVKTGIGILDHMLELFTFHGLFDLEIGAKGDLHIDIHHTNEDVGIVLGQAFKKALKDKEGIKRFGSASVPMEEVVASVAVDISGRGSFNLTKSAVLMEEVKDEKEGYGLSDAYHFFDSFAKHLGMNLNVKIEPVVADLHTDLEPVFKALGIALDAATQTDPRRRGVPSTKGIID